MRRQAVRTPLEESQARRTGTLPQRGRTIKRVQVAKRELMQPPTSAATRSTRRQRSAFSVCRRFAVWSNRRRARSEYLLIGSCPSQIRLHIVASSLAPAHWRWLLLQPPRHSTSGARKPRASSRRPESLAPSARGQVIADFKTGHRSGVFGRTDAKDEGIQISPMDRRSVRSGASSTKSVKKHGRKLQRPGSNRRLCSPAIAAGPDEFVQFVRSSAIHVRRARCRPLAPGGRWAKVDRLSLKPGCWTIWTRWTMRFGPATVATWIFRQVRNACPGGPRSGIMRPCKPPRRSARIIA
jgi:hypothetical protein